MANLKLHELYEPDYSELITVHGAYLQLHITAQCDQNCRHCYMHASPSYKNQIDNPLSSAEFIKLIDEYVSFLRKYNCFGGTIAITGGDPILSPCFWDILEHVSANYIDYLSLVVLGNPFHVDIEASFRMKTLGVVEYQISIDGLRSKHDYLRQPGSFCKSLEAFKTLHRAGIHTVAACTISKENVSDLIPLMGFIWNCDYIDAFGFDRLIPTGNSAGRSDLMLSGDEYKDILFEILKKERENSAKPSVVRKEKLWRLLFYQLGLTDPIDTAEQKTISGCFCGIGTASILADGTFYPCRRLDVPAGNYPEKSFSELFIKNEVTKRFLDVDSYEGCSSCILRAYCRGCPASKFAVTGNFFARDPLCWV